MRLIDILKFCMYGMRFNQKSLAKLIGGSSLIWVIVFFGKCEPKLKIVREIS